VVLGRGWQAEALPVVLAAVRRKSRIEEELLPLCRSFRDPAFHEWMRRDFTLDVPTVLYWESMPDLAAELPARLEKEWERRAYSIPKARAALAVAGYPPVLSQLLKDLGRKETYSRPEVAALLARSVRDAMGNPPAPTGLKLKPNGEPEDWPRQEVSPEFLNWFAGLTEKDFTFDRAQRRFIRQPSAPQAP